ncbi:MAG: AraC family transcriptional regulator [Butyrivibrio sp.]|nr:AraC family transcriptional regulator [Butyrivibrio sp.]
MKKELRSAFNTRQYMLSKDFEVFYYSDLHFKAVPEHSHDYYEFYFFLEGDVSMVIAGKEMPIKPGDLMLMPPRVRHHAIINDNDKPYRRFVFWISQDYCNDLLKKSPDYIYIMQHAITSKEYIYHFDVIEFSALQSRLFTLLDEIYSERFGKDAKVALSAEELILQINRSVYEQKHKQSENESTNTYHSISSYINDHLEEDLTLESISEHFFLSKYYIAHLFQDNTGISIHKYITKKRLTAICSALRSGSNITKTYEQFGFKDYSSFFRAFKKEYGISPKEYQINHNL